MASSLMKSAVRVYSEMSGKSEAITAKNASPTIATVASSSRVRAFSRVFRDDTVSALAREVSPFLNYATVRCTAHLTKAYSPECVEEEFSELRLHGGSAAKGGTGPLEEPALPHYSFYSLVGVHSTHVARDVFDGCLHHRPVVGGGMDHRSISGGYAHVGDRIACLVEEHQVSRLS